MKGNGDEDQDAKNEEQQKKAASGYCGHMIFYLFLKFTTGGTNITDFSFQHSIPPCSDGETLESQGITST